MTADHGTGLVGQSQVQMDVVAAIPLGDVAIACDDLVGTLERQLLIGPFLLIVIAQVRSGETADYLDDACLEIMILDQAIQFVKQV